MTLEEARAHIKDWQNGKQSFASLVLESMSKADAENRRKLAILWPELDEALRTWEAKSIS